MRATCWIHVCVVFIVLSPPAQAEVISIAVGVGSAFVISTFFASYQYAKCKFYECCDDHWIPANTTVLRELLEAKVHGQHLVVQTVVRAIRAHVERAAPSKALVLSFHGWTGSGKNFVSQLVADSLFRRGLQSSFVHLFISSLHFPHAQNAQLYKNQLHDWIRGNVTRCASSLFIFDETDKMEPNILDAVKPFVDYYEQLNGIDFRKSIFIFLSNAGGNDITQRALDFWQEGRLRESIQLNDLEPLINVAAFNEQGGFHFGSLLSNHLVDHFVPFLPLERRHVYECVRDYFRLNGLDEPAEERVRRVADTLQYFPERSKVFSSSGCKRVAHKVQLLLEEEADARENDEL